MAAPKSGKTAKKIIDLNVLVSLAERGWSARQIAAAFKVDPTTITRKYSALIEEARQHGAAKLMDILWQRGVTAKSDRILTHLADRILGKVATKVEISNEDLVNLVEAKLATEPKEDS